MSLINRMLQDLDRRQALDTADAGGGARLRRQAGQPRMVLARAGRAADVALAWMGWVAIQLLPRKPLATDLAFLAASEARARTPVKPPAPPVIEQQPRFKQARRSRAAAPALAPATAGARASPPCLPRTTLRMATELQTPIVERPTQPGQAPRGCPGQAESDRDRRAAKPAATANVDKRDRTRSANDNAETHFRRAALLLNNGRVSEAEEQLLAALQADPRHAAARQAYVSLLLEQRRVAAARRVLQDALALEPAQPTFALALARIHAAERDYTAALAVIDRAAPIGEGSPTSRRSAARCCSASAGTKKH